MNPEAKRPPASDSGVSEGADRALECQSEETPAAPPEPPGLGAIRRFFRRPWIQGIWLWLRAIGRGLRAGWKWLDKNAGPIARGIEKAGNTAVRASRGVA